MNLGRNFEPRTLEEMRKLEPLAFEKAGLSVPVGAALHPDSKRAEQHAERFYEAIRNRTSDSDVKNIAKNINFPEKVVKDIKHHVFLDKHDLGGGDFDRFAPDYNIAQAWARLEQGKQTEVDMILVRHELFELVQMRRHGYDYKTAHAMANAIHNWEAELKKPRKG